MLSLKPFPCPAFLPNPKTFPLLKPRFPTSLKMSGSLAAAAVSQEQIVEHVVLFKVNPATPPSSIATMLTSLNGLLTSVPSVLHLTAAPILRTNSPFTHLLHSRYPSSAALADYVSHPSHQNVVREAVLPICGEIMSLDWVPREPGLVGPAVVAPGKAVKVCFLKLKEGSGEEGKGEVLEVIAGMKGKVGGGLEAVSFGENFSPGRAKGFGIGSVAVFTGKEEMEAADKEEVVATEKDKVRGLLEEVIVVDFVVPEKETTASL